jgi:hypothetical protein
MEKPELKNCLIELKKMESKQVLSICVSKKLLKIHNKIYIIYVC